MRLFPCLLLAGCFTADRIVVVVKLDEKAATAALREDLDNVWPDAVDCDDGDLAACVEGVRKALHPDDQAWTRAWARVTDGSLDIGYEGELPVEKLPDLNITRVSEARKRRARERYAILVEPKPNESVAVTGRWRRYDYTDGDEARELWVMLGRKHTVTMEWLATEEGKVVTAPKWVTPEIEAALRGAGLLTD